MIDILSADEAEGQDLGMYDTQVSKAENILSTQLGALEYLQDFGIDLRYFLTEDFKFQNESFKAYCVERLVTSGINVAEVIEQIEALAEKYTFNISPEETSTGLVAR